MLCDINDFRAGSSSLSKHMQHNQPLVNSTDISGFVKKNGAVVKGGLYAMTLELAI
jgi:hypothetical protein